MIIQETVIRPDGSVEVVEKEVGNDYYNPQTPPPPPIPPDERIAALEAENQSLRDIASQTSTDFQAFLDYYFTVHPDEA